MLGSQSRQQRLFILQIEDDRQRIIAITDRPARHFRYPGGLYLAEFPEWLPECGALSVTITKPGLATRKTSRYLLPRLIGHGPAHYNRVRRLGERIRGSAFPAAHVVMLDHRVEESLP